MEDFLDTAIDRNSPAVLSMPSAGMVRHYKTRMLRRCDGGFWVEGIPTEIPLIESLIRSAEPVGISFKIGTRAVCCIAPFRELNPDCQLQAGGVAVMGIRMERPTTVKAVQRRSDFRVPVHAGDPLEVMIWRIGDHTPVENIPKHDPLTTTVRDLSVGGLGVIFVGKDGKPPRVCELDRLRVVIGYGKETYFVLEGNCTTPRRIGDTDQYTAGIKFNGLQSGLSGRRTMTALSKIVSDLQITARQRAAG